MSTGAAIAIIGCVSVSVYVIRQQVRGRQQNAYVLARSAVFLVALAVIAMIWLVRRAS